jgi:hypothetical protein
LGALLLFLGVRILLFKKNPEYQYKGREKEGGFHLKFFKSKVFLARVLAAGFLLQTNFHQILT